MDTNRVGQTPGPFRLRANPFQLLRPTRKPRPRTEISAHEHIAMMARATRRETIERDLRMADVQLLEAKQRGVDLGRVRGKAFRAQDDRFQELLRSDTKTASPWRKDMPVLEKGTPEPETPPEIRARQAESGVFHMTPSPETGTKKRPIPITPGTELYKQYMAKYPSTPDVQTQETLSAPESMIAPHYVRRAHTPPTETEETFSPSPAVQTKEESTRLHQMQRGQEIEEKAFSAETLSERRGREPKTPAVQTKKEAEQLRQMQIKQIQSELETGRKTLVESVFEPAISPKTPPIPPQSEETFSSSEEKFTPTPRLSPQVIDLRRPLPLVPRSPHREQLKGKFLTKEKRARRNIRLGSPVTPKEALPKLLTPASPPKARPQKYSVLEEKVSEVATAKHQYLGTEERAKAAKEFSRSEIKRFARAKAQKIVGDPDAFQYRVEGVPIPSTVAKGRVSSDDYKIDPGDPYGLLTGVTLQHMGESSPRARQRVDPTIPRPAPAPPVESPPLGRLRGGLGSPSPRARQRVDTTIPHDPELPPPHGGLGSPHSTVQSRRGPRGPTDAERMHARDAELIRLNEAEEQKRRNLPYPGPQSESDIPSVPELRREEEKDPGEKDPGETGVRLPTLQDLISKIRFTSPTRDLYPTPFGTSSGPVIVQSGMGAQKQQPAQPSQIIVKQTVKQVVGTEQRKRKKKVKSGEKATLKRIKNEYSVAKKQVKKDITAAKKKYYETENAKIKLLPSKKRASSRNALKAEIKKKQGELAKSMPSTGRMKYNDIAALIRKIRLLKW